MNVAHFMADDGIAEALTLAMSSKMERLSPTVLCSQKHLRRQAIKCETQHKLRRQPTIEIRDQCIEAFDHVAVLGDTE